MKLKKDKAENSLQKRLQIKNLRRILLILGLVIAAACTFSIVKYQLDVKEAAQEAELKRLQEEVRANEEKQQIDTTLDKHIYGKELRASYETYPQMKKMLLNLEDYPGNIVEFLVTHSEVVDWVVN